MNSAGEIIENAFFKKRDQELIEKLKHSPKKLSISEAINSIENMCLHNQDDSNNEEALKVIKAALNHPKIPTELEFQKYCTTGNQKSASQMYNFIIGNLLS
jgi:hypothetical protein